MAKEFHWIAIVSLVGYKIYSKELECGTPADGRGRGVDECMGLLSSLSKEMQCTNLGMCLSWGDKPRRTRCQGCCKQQCLIHRVHWSHYGVYILQWSSDDWRCTGLQWALYRICNLDWAAFARPYSLTLRGPGHATESIRAMGHTHQCQFSPN